MSYNVTEIWSFNDLYDSSWGGAINTLKTIMENNKEDELLSWLNDLIDTYNGSGIDRTALNDILWFDSELVFETLDIEEE